MFLTGQLPFTDGFAGGIYFGISSDMGGLAWQYLGYISNDKPSAIFKISSVKPTIDCVNPFGEAMMASIGDISSTTVLIAISVESTMQISQLTAATNTKASKVDSFVEFSQKMLENFFNYASSFAVNPIEGPINPMHSYVPLPVVQTWFDNFLRRLQNNPNFWKNM